MASMGSALLVNAVSDGQYTVSTSAKKHGLSLLCAPCLSCVSCVPCRRWPMDGWPKRQTDRQRTGQDSSWARIQSYTIQRAVRIPCGPLATLRFIPGRTGVSRRIQAQRPHRIVVGTISKSAATGELCPTLLTLCPHSLADSLTHGRGHGGGPAQCRALVPSDKSWLVHSP